MSWINRIVNAIRGSEERPPRTGQLLRRRKEDTWRDYPADGLTPQRLVAILKEADAGSPSAQLALYEQMEEKDAHLYSVAHTRRLAVTGLPWEIVSAAEMPGWASGRAGATAPSRALADVAAAYCHDALRALPAFEEALSHLALAVGRNIALAELVWEAGIDGLTLADMVPVDFARIVFDDFDAIRILTEDEPMRGIAPPPHKFICHTPHAVTGHPERGGLLRVTAFAFLAKRFAIKDWLIFAEVFGMPVRIGKYAPNATPEEKRELLGMLQQLGADATAIFSKAVDLEILQTRVPGETNLYENLCIYLDREISKAWLGQTLTTDTARVRSNLTVAQVHDRVRKDIRDDDLRREARTIRRDLLTPLTELRFGADVPVPHFRRVLDHTHDPEVLGRVLATAVNDLGARVPARWAHAALGLPEAGANDPALPGRSR